MDNAYGCTSIVVGTLYSAVSLLPTLLTYLLLLLIAVYCWYRWSHRELLRVAADLPVTHKAWPILGHSYRSIKDGEDPALFLLEISKVVVAKGLKTACFWCGPIPLIMVHDIEDIQTILNSSIASDKGDEYEFFKIGLGYEVEQGPGTYSLLTAPGHVWRVSRKHMNPLFHPRNLEHMVPVFNLNSRELVSCLSGNVGHGPVNLMPHTMNTALKTVCNLLFGTGIDIDKNSSDFRDLVEVVKTIPDLFTIRLLRPWLRIEAVFRFLYRRQLKRLNQRWNNFTKSRLEMAREISAQRNLKTSSLDKDDQAADLERSSLVDVYSTLMSSYPEFTEAGLHFDMLSFYCTGSDSVGVSISSCLLALAQFQNVQERLYQEVCSVVGPDDDVTLQDINRMPYLDQVVKETLRWFVVVPYILRKVSKDLQLSTCTIPAGSTVVVGLVGIHMDPKIYKEPLKFNPDRFSHESSTAKERFTYIPFSGGPRNCIAKTYAMQLMKIMVVHVLRRYKLSTEMDIYKLRKRLVVTLMNADGYNIQLEKRH